MPRRSDDGARSDDGPRSDGAARSDGGARVGAEARLGSRGSGRGRTRNGSSGRGAAVTAPEDERLPLGSTFAYGLQHVLTMYGGIIAPPLIIGTAAGMSSAEIGMLVAACLFVGGAATLLQTLGLPFFGSKLPLVQGVSFAGVATMTAILDGDGGIQSVFGAVMAASVVGLLITPVFAKVIRFFPPVVNGVVITVIGLSLMPVAANWAMGGDAAAPDHGSMGNIGLAALTLLVVLLLSKVGSGTISRLSILLAIVVGTVFAFVIGKADFSEVGEGDIFALPTPFAFGPPTFEIAAIISMLIVILVTLTETTADILAVGEITGSKVSSRRIANGLRADMLSSALSPVFNSFTQSAFAQNVGLVAITGVKSRFVVSAGGAILVVLGLLPVLGRIMAAVPTPVLGGAGIVLFGTVAASGIRTLAKVDYRNNMNLIIVAVSLGVGMVPIAAPTFYEHFPSWFGTIFDSSISSAAVIAILMNILFNHVKAGNPENPSVFAATDRAIDPARIACLQEGDHVEDGRLLDADGHELAVVPEEPAADAPADGTGAAGTGGAGAVETGAAGTDVAGAAGTGQAAEPGDVGTGPAAAPAGSTEAGRRQP